MAYKHKSGAQKRKERAMRQTSGLIVQSMPTPKATLVPASNSWGPPPGSSEQWDPNGPPIELPIYGQPPPTLVRQVAGALLQLEQGSFYQSAYLWDGMTRDDRVAATIGQRIDRLIGSPLELEPADLGDAEEDSPEDDAEDSLEQQVADAAMRQIKKIMPPHQVYELMRYALGLSVGVAQRLTTRTVKSTVPTFDVWNPRNLRFDWLLRKFRLITENRGEITLDEEDPEWIIYQPYGPKGWLHGALIRSIAQPWLIRYWTRTWWSRRQEVHGQPLRLGVLPADRSPKDEAAFLSQLSNLAHEAVIRIPQGTDGNRFDVKLLEANSRDWEGFQQLLSHCDDSIAIAVLGQRQSTMGQGGLGAQDNAGESTIARITRKDALVADILREKLLMPWADDNFGNEELAPYICWRSEPAEDEKEAANTDYLVGQALVQFKQASAPIDVRAYLEDRGYPLLTPEQEAQAKAEASDQEAAQAATAHQRALELQQAKGPDQGADQASQTSSPENQDNA